jgi:hypothetical protein
MKVGFAQDYFFGTPVHLCRPFGIARNFNDLDLGCLATALLTQRAQGHLRLFPILDLIATMST